MNFDVITGDARCIEREDCSMDSCVTDPPYEFAFMGKSWDASGIAYSVEMWREVLRVLKPGAHLLAFGGTRTFHRMVCAIEDAGFEIRDSIQWVYGSGFPKSLDVSKAIDAMLGAEREVIGKRTDGRYATGFSDQAKRAMGDLVHAERQGFSGEMGVITAPATDEAQAWDGWGTALKPAHEIICLARKPLSESTVAANVLRWGTGAINVDACRIGIGGQTKWEHPRGGGYAGGLKDYGSCPATQNAVGRWPSNIILSHSPNCDGQCTDDCPVRLLDEQSGELTTGGGNKANQLPLARQSQVIPTQDTGQVWSIDKGGASRFFHIAEWGDLDFLVPFYYCAKASRSERNNGCEDLEPKRSDYRPNDPEEDTIRTRLHNSNASLNHHPTVKPVSLLRYLCRLITPKNGTVIDPFMGSGSTGVAADKESFNFIGIEKEAEYVEIAKARIRGKVLPLFSSELREEAD